MNAVTIDSSGTLGKGSVVSTTQFNAMQSSMARALAVTDAQFNQLSGRVGVIEDRLDGFDLRFRKVNSGIAAAVALGGVGIVPGKAVSVSMNVSTYRGEQGFAGSIAGRVTDSVYVTAGVAGATNGAATGRVGMMFGF